MTPHEVLKRYWGYDAFRPTQLEIIESVLAGRDTLGLMPTGGGKSITFQVPAMMLEGLTIVVTPLISLMKDQTDNLLSRGIRAARINSSMSLREQRLALARCELGKAKMLYVSPEKLQSPGFMQELRLFNVSLIVVDEAHCISQWGYDFRPSYLKIADARRLCPGAPVLALTASATPRVTEDIMEKLGFAERRVFRHSFARENLAYKSLTTRDKLSALAEELRGTQGSAIVYARSRRKTREVADFLLSVGISADYYHAGLTPEAKEYKQSRWKSGELRVMVATTAFGMGIDKPDVRFVAHVDLPGTLEEYYQEAGRAGRDGLPSTAMMLLNKYDESALAKRIAAAFPSKPVIQHVYEMLGNFLNIGVGEGYNTVNEFNMQLFCERFSIHPLTTLGALRLLTQAGYIEYVDETDSPSRATALTRRDELYDLTLSDTADRTLYALLRLYTGLFSGYADINEEVMARESGQTTEEVYQGLLTLSRMGVIHYVPRTRASYVIYTTSREEPRYIQLPDTVYRSRRELMERRARAVNEFAFGDKECRANLLLKYFGEEPGEPCGKCSVCLRTARSKSPVEARRKLDETIILMASSPAGALLNEIARASGMPLADAQTAARELADRGEIEIASIDGQLRLFKRQ